MKLDLGHVAVPQEIGRRMTRVDDLDLARGTVDGGDRRGDEEAPLLGAL